MGGQSEGAKYDVNTELTDADERALQKAHEILGAAIDNIDSVIDIGAMREARELIGNVLASAEPAEVDNLG